MSDELDMEVPAGGGGLSKVVGTCQDRWYKIHLIFSSLGREQSVKSAT